MVYLSTSKYLKCGTRRAAPVFRPFRITLCLPDVAAAFCRNVAKPKRGTPSAAGKLCYMKRRT